MEKLPPFRVERGRDKILKEIFGESLKIGCVKVCKKEFSKIQILERINSREYKFRGINFSFRKEEKRSCTNLNKWSPYPYRIDIQKLLQFQKYYERLLHFCHTLVDLFVLTFRYLKSPTRIRLINRREFNSNDFSQKTMLTMSWISPFCKRNVRFSFHRDGWFDRCKTRDRTNSFIPANFSNIIVYRGYVRYLKRRERGREWQAKLTNETSIDEKWNVMIYELIEEK